MTNKQYISFGGAACPFCGVIGRIIADNFEPGGAGVISRNTYCICDKQWDEVYVLKGYAEVK